MRCGTVRGSRARHGVMRACSPYPLAVLACSLLLVACAHAEPDHNIDIKGTTLMMKLRVKRYGAMKDIQDKYNKDYENSSPTEYYRLAQSTSDATQMSRSRTDLGYSISSDSGVDRDRSNEKVKRIQEKFEQDHKLSSTTQDKRLEQSTSDTTQSSRSGTDLGYSNSLGSGLAESGEVVLIPVSTLSSSIASHDDVDDSTVPLTATASPNLNGAPPPKTFLMLFNCLLGFCFITALTAAVTSLWDVIRTHFFTLKPMLK